jgi:D-alanyl-D-alanine carboxypeptidase/D-alanyl-D-alanine-endopeptidase (penicillin-binding protein 4)
LNFGPQFTFETPYWIDTSKHRVEICLRGSGDPSITSDRLRQLAQQVVKQLPPSTAVVDLALDRSFFESLVDLDFSTWWEFGDMIETYGAQPSSFMLDENSVNLWFEPGAKAGAPARFGFYSAAATLALPVLSTVITTNDSSANVQYWYAPAESRLFVAGTLGVHSARQNISVAAWQPSTYFANVLAYYLAQSGVAVHQIRLDARCPAKHHDNSTPDGTVRSATLQTLMAQCLLISDNLYAESFMKALGARVGNQTAFGSTYAAGIDVVRRTLQSKLGLSPTLHNQIDGSGLAQQNMATPRALATVFERMYTGTEYAKMYRAMLPVAGVSGTLANRFRNTSAQGIVQAKTGTLTGASALSGYMEHKEFPLVVFSIFVNNFVFGTPTAE